MQRKEFLKNAAAIGLAVAALPGYAGVFKRDKAPALPPIRRITKGDRFHWFGYYDKWQVDATNRYVLCNEVDFEGRTPTADDTIRIGMIDLQDNDKWIDLGGSHSWSWQQGCMLQWMPGAKEEIIWNDRVDGRFVSHILNVRTGRKRTLPDSIYALSPDGKWAITTSFSRIQDMYAGYGYAGVPDRNKNILAPENDGIWKMNLETGALSLIVSVAQLAAIANPYDAEFGEAKHYFNHLLINPDGTRFVFLHRWKYADKAKNARYADVGGFGTRMVTASMSGADLRIIDPFNYTSHFVWRDREHILAWTRLPEKGDGFFLFKDSAVADIQQVGKGIMTVNGHCTYLPGNRWVLNDTYPGKGQRLQSVFLFDVRKEQRIALADLYAPEAYRGEWRCDTHPRFSPDGKSVIVDSAHEGMGRQLYLIDISGIV